MPAIERSGVTTLLLDAALQSIPCGFCVWSPQFELLVWNKPYLSLYNFPEAALHPGISLEAVAAHSVHLGNHPGQTAETFAAAFRAQLLGNREGGRARMRDVLARGRTIELTHVHWPGLGWMITHEDVTEAMAPSGIVQDGGRDPERQRLEAAVNNISQGLCMFDAQGRLVICNQPYARIYGLPEPLLKPGSLLEDILAHLFDIGMSASGGTREDYIRWRREVIARGEYGKNIHELNGRIILMQHHPMKDGGWVSTHEDITEQRQQEARIEHLARHDALTELPNRTQFLEQMEGLETALSRGDQAAVLCIDLDHFKAVNDTHGHAIGDKVLKQASARLWGATRETDLLARLGGDEFALLLTPVNGHGDAAAIAERIVKSMQVPFAIDGQMIQLGASVGIAMAPADGENADTLMKNGDLALYRAKAEGRSTYHFFEAGMDAALQKRRAIEAGLRNALGNNELRLVFQPLVGLRENRVTGLEALLRWDHPERGAISPVEFIPVAEETGLIVQIGEWVLREACKVAVGWPGRPRIAVNLSPVQFKNRRLFDTVVSALKDAALPPTRLELEITESLLLNDSESTLETLHRLRSIGVRISMDDFGTGYSSLSYLRSFPFDKIKIDRSFMRDLDTKGDSLAIIKAVIGLGQSLGMSTTAEGVETEAQLKVVRDQGCTEGQGYYFSPPLAPGAVQNLLAAQAAKLAHPPPQRLQRTG